MKINIVTLFTIYDQNQRKDNPQQPPCQIPYFLVQTNY